MEWTQAGLRKVGFTGYSLTFGDLDVTLVPDGHGEYVVTRLGTWDPVFLQANLTAPRKGRSPSVDRSILAARVHYLGRAADRARLRQRLRQYQVHGQGFRLGHWGGRYIWQLQDAGRLLVGWKESDGDVAGEVDVQDAIVGQFGALPFANIRRACRTLPRTSTDLLGQCALRRCLCRMPFLAN